MKKKILIIATGSVAIEKLDKTYELLCQKFCVKVVASNYVLKNFEFSSKIKFEEISTKLNTFPKHIELAKWADQILVIPASANTLAKFNAGIADTTHLTILLAARQPIIFVPAMNSYMYKSLNERNIINNLANLGHMFIGPEVGMLKEGEVGIGRMTEPKDITNYLENFLLQKKDKKKILISIGASRTYIDPIRYITNNATGQFGKLIANELRMQGHHVEIIDIKNLTNEEALGKIKQKNIDIYISTAAFSDFKPEKISETKIKKGTISEIKLKNNIDVLSNLDTKKIKVYGFKLSNKKEGAIEKMSSLNLAGIIWNKIPAMGNCKISGSIILKNKEIEFHNSSKIDLAKTIAKEIG